jgi:tRNA pseudouridine55 synthase
VIINGVLNLNKPAGETSMDMVRMVKRLTSEKKVGHGGTLDPIASGVLPICFGQATRLMDPLVDGTKLYRTKVRLGETTDTYDSNGTIVATADATGVTREDIEAVLEGFRGEIAQVPPMYSALKHGGERLYNLARAGFEVEREARTVQVSRLEILEWDSPDAVFDIECGRGVYVRSIGHDVGQALGCGAHVIELERRKAGPFLVEDGVTPEDFAKAVEAGTWRDFINTPDTVVKHLPASMVNEAMESFVKNGRPVTLGPRETTSDVQHGELWRVYSHDGQFLALARFDKPLGQWKPEKVFDPDPSTRLKDPALS